MKSRKATRCIARGLTIEQLERRQLLTAALPSIASHGELSFVNTILANQTVSKTNSFLSSAKDASAATIARNYLATHTARFALAADDVSNAVISDNYTDPDVNGGMTHVYFQQTLNGLPVLNVEVSVHLMPDGSVLSVNGAFSDEVDSLTGSSTKPAISAATAIAIAAQQLGLAAPTAAEFAGEVTTAKLNRQTTVASAISQDPIVATLTYALDSNGVPELAWRFDINLPNGQHWYDVAVSTASQQVIYAYDRVLYYMDPDKAAALKDSGDTSTDTPFSDTPTADPSFADGSKYSVIARPSTSPTDGGFTVATNPSDTLASPYGWQDTNGAAGAEFTDTRGNNVDAHLDRNNDNVADTTTTAGTSPSRPTNASLDFSGFTFNSATVPTTDQNQYAAEENVFYLNNILHDIHYRYGFTSAAGNFQTNTYGMGGTGNDAVQADAQDGGGTDNANFSNVPDGTAGRMQMYLFTATNPQRDGDFDAEVVDHEYGHGVSTRLSGGPSDTSSLSSTQSGGMGEGWSDFYSLMFEQKSTDQQTDAYPVGTYVENNTAGIRRYPYSFNTNIDPETIALYNSDSSHEVHNTGEIWATTLWDLNWLLINKYGFDPNIQNGYNSAAPKGNTLELQLVMNAMKLQAANPSFKDARDAILQADQALDGGADTAQIWAAFARRGMGVNFVDASASATSVTPDFTLPTGASFVTSSASRGTAIAPSSMSFTFNQAMNTSSFTVASDVVSFTGPGGTNLIPNITGFSWTSSTTLQVNFTGVSGSGTASMVIGPNILSASSGAAMDQNLNGISGEASDTYTGTLAVISQVGPDAAGYKTVAFPYQSVDLTIGGSGVTTLLNGSDDGSAAVALGANTFNFYGTSYTGSTLFANVNGFVTLGGASTSTSPWVNTTLTTDPTLPVIAPLWDDWRTDVNVSGATDSAVLYKLDTANNLLTIEWSDVATYNGSGTGTFQAILQLNTGATPGRIIYNYVDTDVTGVGTDGASATVGIKASGSQGTSRLLTTFNTVHPFVGSNQAVLTATDVTGPTETPTYNYATTPSVSVVFNKAVTGVDTSDFKLVNTITSAVTPFTLTVNSSTTATLSFPSFPSGILPDGNYTLTTTSTGITDSVGNPLDGDGDGVLGGDSSFKFFALAGDINRDHAVNIADLGILATNYGHSGSFAQGDLNHDGVINIGDLGILATDYGATLPPLASGLPGAGALPMSRHATVAVDVLG